MQKQKNRSPGSAIPIVLDSSNKAGESKAAMTCVGIFFAVFLCIPTLALFNADDEEFFPTLFFIICSAAIIIPIFMMIAYPVFKQWRVSRYVDKAVVTVTPYPAYAGDALHFSYQQIARTDITVEIASFRLVLRESATYTRGTDTYTETHDHLIAEKTESPGRLLRGENINLSFTLQLPEKAMHSFYASNNQLRWLLLIKLEIPDGLNFEDSYELLVSPKEI